MSSRSNPGAESRERFASAANRCANETVVASLDDERIDLPGIMIQNESRAQTDEQGRFVIERIVPGEAQRALATQLRRANDRRRTVTIRPRSEPSARARPFTWT